MSKCTVDEVCKLIQAAISQLEIRPAMVAAKAELEAASKAWNLAEGRKKELRRVYDGLVTAVRELEPIRSRDDDVFDEAVRDAAEVLKAAEAETCRARGRFDQAQKLVCEERQAIDRLIVALADVTNGYFDYPQLGVVKQAIKFAEEKEPSLREAVKNAERLQQSVERQKKHLCSAESALNRLQSAANLFALEVFSKAERTAAMGIEALSKQLVSDEQAYQAALERLSLEKAKLHYLYEIDKTLQQLVHEIENQTREDLPPMDYSYVVER